MTTILDRVRRGCGSRAMALALAALAASIIAPAPVSAQADTQHSFEIPAQPLSRALVQFGRQARMQVSADGMAVDGLASPGVSGAMPAAQALSALLAGTGLTFRLQGNTATLERAPRAAAGGDDAIALGPVRVEGAGGSAVGADPGAYRIHDAGRTEGSPSYAASANSTSFKLPLTIQETPQTVVVITQAVIEDFNLTDVREVLEFTPGVFTMPERSERYFYFESRGFAMQTQIDGVSSPNGMGQRGNNFAPDTAIFDRIEILQGASGLLAGSGAPGGVVNMIRKTPTTDFQLIADASVDTWGGWRGVVDLSTPIGDNGLGVRMVGVLERQDSFIDYVNGMHGMVYGLVEQKVGENTVLAAGFTIDEIFDTTPGPHYGIPLILDGDYSGYTDRSLNLAATWAWLREKGRNAFVRGQHDFGAGWKGQALLQYESFETDSVQAIPFREWIDPTQQMYLGSQKEDWDSKNWTLDVNLTGDFELLGGNHMTMLGVNGGWRTNRGEPYRGCDYSSTHPNEFVPGPIIDPGTWDARRAPTCPAFVEYWGAWTQKTKNIGVYAGTRIELLDPLHLLIGGRLTWYQQSSDGVVAIRENAVFTPYGALTFDITKNLTTYVSYTDIFEPHGLNTIDANGAVIKPKTGKSYEVGLKLSLFDGRLNAQGNYHWNDQTNIAVELLNVESPGICGPAPAYQWVCHAASGKVPGHGWDVSIQGEVVPGLQVIGGYSDTFADIDWGPNNKKFWNIGATYTAPSGRWQIGATVKHQSGYYNSETYPSDWPEGYPQEITFTLNERPFTIVGVTGRYTITENITASFEVENLFDRKYFAPQYYYGNSPVWGNPRQATVTVRAQF